MIAETTLIATKWKALAGCTAVAVLAAADSVVTPATLEDYGLKGLLIISLIFVVRLLLRQQADHKVELREQQAQHREEASRREERMLQAIHAQVEGLEQLTLLTKEQTDYFKSVTRNILDQHLHSRPGHLP